MAISMGETSLPSFEEELPEVNEIDHSKELAAEPVLDISQFGRQFKEFVERSGGLPDIETTPKSKVEKKSYDELAKLIAKNRLTLEKLKKRMPSKAELSPEVRVALEESLDAAEHNKALEASLERRHEIKDISDNDHGDSSSVASILATKNLPKKDNIHDPEVQKNMSKMPNKLRLPNITYRSAIYYGKRGGIVIAVILSMLYLLLSR